MKLVSLKRTKDDKAAEGRDGAVPSSIDDSRDGADLHLESDHMEKMGIDPGLPHGHPISIEAHGTVHRSSDGPEGGRMQIRLHKMGADYDKPKGDEDNALRGEIEKNTKDSDKKAGTKAAAKGGNIPEKAGAKAGA